MNKIVRIEGNCRQLDQRVVTAGKEEERDHIHNGQHASAADHGRVNTALGQVPVDIPDRDQNASTNVQDEEEQLSSAWQGANVDGG